MADEMRPGDHLADADGPAERRLSEHLAVVRANPPEASGNLASRVLRSARWQRLVRAPITLIGTLIGALADAFSAWSGARRERPGSRR